MATLPIEEIAKLSNLTMTPVELAQMCSQLEKTVEYVDNLQELNTNSTPPTSSPSGNSNIFFEDETDNSRKIPSGVYKVSRILT